MSFIVAFSSNKKILYVLILSLLYFYYLLITYFNIAACKDKDFPSRLEFA